MKRFFGKVPTLLANVLIAAAVWSSMNLKIPFLKTLPLHSANASETSTEAEPVPSGSTGLQPGSSAPLPVVSRPASSAAASVPSAAGNSSEVTVASSAAPAFQMPDDMVGKDYFDDALFIGDSITEDLMNYGGIGNAKFFCHVGLSVYQLFEHPKTDDATGRTLEQTLRSRHFGKIYILLGINELGTANTDYFVRHYSSAIEQVRRYDPNAVFFVESILPVTEEKSENDKVFTNANIRARNGGLQTLENGRNIFYLDLSPVLNDGAGNLRADYSGDGVHIKAKYYRQLSDYLRVCTSDALKRSGAGGH